MCHAEMLGLRDKECHGVHRLCQYSGKKHVVLSGLRAGGFQTAQAEAYPELLAQALADGLHHAIMRKASNERWALMRASRVQGTASGCGYSTASRLSLSILVGQ